MTRTASHPSRPQTLVDLTGDRITDWVALSQPDDEGEIWLPPLQALARQLGVSRSVVRESIKQLEMQGRLETRHGVGVRVIDQLHRPVSAAVHLMLPDEGERLAHLVEVRAMLEPAQAARAAERASDADLQGLAAIHDHLVRGASTEEAILADMAFHEELARLSGNRILLLLFQSLSDLMLDSLSRGYAKYSTESAITEHHAILTAVLDRDSPAAHEAMIRHLSTTLTELELPAAVS